MLNETGEQIELKIKWRDYIRYAPMAIKFHIKAWWKGLGNDF